jgi:hypothetical protein
VARTLHTWTHVAGAVDESSAFRPCCKTLCLACRFGSETEAVEFVGVAHRVTSSHRELSPEGAPLLQFFPVAALLLIFNWARICEWLHSDFLVYKLRRQSQLEHFRCIANTALPFLVYCARYRYTSEKKAGYSAVAARHLCTQPPLDCLFSLSALAQ